MVILQFKDVIGANGSNVKLFSAGDVSFPVTKCKFGWRFNYTDYFISAASEVGRPIKASIRATSEISFVR